MTNKILQWAVGLALVLAIAMWGVRMYGNSRVARVEVESAQAVLSEAVLERKDATRVDALQTKERAASVDAVRAVVRSARKETNAIKAIQAETGCAVVDDAERLRVLNRTIRELNERIAAAAVLHD